MRNELRLHRGQLQRRDYRPKGNPFKPPLPAGIAILGLTGAVVLAVCVALFLALAVVTKG